MLDAIFWISGTGAAWRDLPAERGNWNSVHRQFLRWTASGIWDAMRRGLGDHECEDARRMLDRIIERAHRRHLPASAATRTSPPFFTGIGPASSDDIDGPLPL